MPRGGPINRLFTHARQILSDIPMISLGLPAVTYVTAAMGMSRNSSQGVWPSTQQAATYHCSGGCDRKECHKQRYGRQRKRENVVNWGVGNILVGLISIAMLFSMTLEIQANPTSDDLMSYYYPVWATGTGFCDNDPSRRPSYYNQVGTTLFETANECYNHW